MTLTPLHEQLAHEFLSSDDEGGIAPEDFETLAKACNVRLPPRALSSANGELIAIRNYGLRFTYIRGRAKPRFVGLINARAKVRAAVEAYFAQRAAVGEHVKASIDTLSCSTALDL